MKIAILDDYNHLAGPHVEDLREAAEIDIFDDTILPSRDLDGLIARLKPYDVICTMRERTPISKAVLDGLPNLKVLLTTGMRNLGIDVDEVKRRGIIMAGTPGGSAAPGTPPDFNATVQHTWALILALVTNIPRDHGRVVGGAWGGANPMNTFIGGQTLGLLGLGRLGAGTGRIAKLAYGMKIIAWSENLTQAKADEAAEKAGLRPGDFRCVTKQELFEQSDVLSVHYVLSDRSRGLVGSDDLGRMKPTSFLINTSRGPIVQEDALLECLERGKIRGAAIDVFDIEPLPRDSRWRTTAWDQDGRSEVVLTPHTGYSFEDTLQGMWRATAENLKRIVDGKEPQWLY